MSDTTAVPSQPDTAVAATAGSQTPNVLSKKELRRQERDRRWRAIEASLARTASLEQQVAVLNAKLASGTQATSGTLAEPSLHKHEQDIATLKEEIRKRDDALAREKRAAAVRSAAAAVNWFDMDDAVSKLLPKVEEIDGRWVVPVQETVAGTNVTNTNLLTLEQAAAHLARTKPYLVRATVGGGTGASGGALGGNSASTLRTQITKWSQVKDNADLRAALILEDPGYAAELQTRWEEKQRAKGRHI